MNRKIFSQKILKSIIGIAALSAVPFVNFKRKDVEMKNFVKVKINPNAVSREKSGSKNV